MSESQSQKSNRSSAGSDEPLFGSQDLSDSSEQNENQMKSSKKITKSESNDKIGVRKSTQLADYCRQMSQTLTQRTDEWKGSHVVNYKTFKKYSQNSSQMSSQKEEVVALKRVKVDFNKNMTSVETNDETEAKTADSEKSNKRKIDSKLDTSPELGSQKKSRH